MTKRITTKTIAKNLSLSLIAQIISLLASFIFGLIVPKFIDEYQYSYWQTFLLYVGYTGILNFGLLDGLVLRYSQYDYDELDKVYVRSQFQLLLFFTSLLTVIGCIISASSLDGITAQIVVLVSVGIITKNIFTYTSYSFQLTNRIGKYAFVVIFQRAVYAVFVVVLLCLRVNNFLWYCIAELSGDFSGILVGSIFNKGLYFGKAIPFKNALKEAWKNVSAGIMLVVANYAASYIVGGAKMIIQWRWGPLEFGQVAFAFSVNTMFLNFVTAISVVLFPSLKRMQQEKLPGMYKRIRESISPLLLGVLLLYFPGCWILEKWLPAYSSSLIYLGILLPCIIFSSKISLLTNNYLKAYRKEKLLPIISIVSLIVGFGLYLLGAYVLNNLDFVLYSVVAVLIVRSVVSEIIVYRLIVQSGVVDFIIETAMAIIFIVALECLSLWWACLIYVCALVIYSIIYHKSIVALARTFISLFRRDKTIEDQS